MPYRVAVLTVSDKGSRGERVDTAGPAVAALVREGGNEVVATAVVPDVRATISDRLRSWADSRAADVDPHHRRYRPGAS